MFLSLLNTDRLPVAKASGSQVWPIYSTLICRSRICPAGRCDSRTTLGGKCSTNLCDIALPHNFGLKGQNGVKGCSCATEFAELVVGRFILLRRV